MDLVTDAIEKPVQVTVVVAYADGSIACWSLTGDLRAPELLEEEPDDVTLADEPPLALKPRRWWLKIPFSRARHVPRDR